MIGKIVKNTSDMYVVKSEKGLYECKARGNFKLKKITPVVGDMVEFDDYKLYIMEIKPRYNYLIRPSVANIDQALIVMSVVEPVLSTNLLDKLLTIIEYNNIKPIICFTKLDLLDNKDHKELFEIINYYQRIGYVVLLNSEIETIKPIFKKKTTVFTGQSGAGKSTLLNMLDSSLNLKTGEISQALGRGRHTTRHTELIELYDGEVLDTPGFSSISFDNMSLKDIRDNFVDFYKYSSRCKYQDCAHIDEVDCAIKELVNSGEILESRYENYIKIVMEKRR